MDEASLQAAVLQQPAHVLYPAVEQLSCGFAEAGWRTAIHASNEHLIPRPLTLSFCAPQPGAARAAELLDALLVCLRLHANVLASDRAVVTVILQADLVQQLPAQLLRQLLDAIPRQLETVRQPLLEIRVAAGSPLPVSRLSQCGKTRLSVIDHAAGNGPQLLEQARQAGFSACCYQLSAAGSKDSLLQGVCSRYWHWHRSRSACRRPQPARRWQPTGLPPGACCARPATAPWEAIATSAATSRHHWRMAKATAIVTLPVWQGRNAVIFWASEWEPAA